jgi:hypothetical protein
MVFRTRPGWILGQAATNGALGAVVLGIVLLGWAGPEGALVGALVGFVGGAAIAVPSIRRRHLVVDDEGLIAHRKAYRVRARWGDLEGFGTMRFCKVVPVETVMLRASTIESHDGTPVADRLKDKVVKAGADRRVQLSVYVADRSEGPFAELLALHRPDLSDPRSTA